MMSTATALGPRDENDAIQGASISVNTPAVISAVAPPAASAM